VARELTSLIDLERPSAVRSSVFVSRWKRQGPDVAGSDGPRGTKEFLVSTLIETGHSTRRRRTLS